VAETRIEPRAFYRWTCICGESGPWYDEPDHSAIRGGRAVHEGRCAASSREETNG
jgi:hypothetical protein